MSQSFDANPRFEQAAKSILQPNSYAMGGPSYRTDTKYRQQDGISDLYGRNNPNDLGYIQTQGRDHIQNIPDFLYNRNNRPAAFNVSPSPDRKNFSKLSISPEDDYDKRGGIYENKTNFARNYKGRLFDYNPNDEESRRENQKKADLKEILLYQIEQKKRLKMEERMRKEMQDREQEQRYQRQQREMQRENMAMAEIKSKRNTNLQNFIDSYGDYPNRLRTPKKLKHHQQAAQSARQQIDQEVQTAFKAPTPPPAVSSSSSNYPISSAGTGPNSPNPNLMGPSPNGNNNNNNNNGYLGNGATVSGSGAQYGQPMILNSARSPVASTNYTSSYQGSPQNISGGMPNTLNNINQVEMQAKYLNHMKEMQIQLYKNRILNEELQMMKKIDDLNSDIKQIGSQNDLLQIRDDILHKLARNERGNTYLNPNNLSSLPNPFLTPVVMMPINFNSPVNTLSTKANNNNNNNNTNAPLATAASEFLPGINSPHAHQAPTQTHHILDQLQKDVFEYPYIPLQDIYGNKNGGTSRKACETMKTPPIENNSRLGFRRSSENPTREYRYLSKQDVRKDLALMQLRKQNIDSEENQPPPPPFDQISSSNSKKRRLTMQKSLKQLNETLPVPETIIYLQNNMSQISNPRTGSKLQRGLNTSSKQLLNKSLKDLHQISIGGPSSLYQRRSNTSILKGNQIRMDDQDILISREDSLLNNKLKNGGQLNSVQSIKNYVNDKRNHEHSINDRQLNDSVNNDRRNPGTLNDINPQDTIFSRDDNQSLTSRRSATIDRATHDNLHLPYETDRPNGLTGNNTLDSNPLLFQNSPGQSRKMFQQSRDEIMVQLNNVRTFVKDKSRQLDLRKTHQKEIKKTFGDL